MLHPLNNYDTIKDRVAYNNNILHIVTNYVLFIVR